MDYFFELELEMLRVGTGDFLLAVLKLSSFIDDDSDRGGRIGQKQFVTLIDPYAKITVGYIKVFDLERVTLHRLALDAGAAVPLEGGPQRTHP